MSAFVRPGQRVLVKVNLLAKAEPERAVTTHPEVVRAVIRSVREAGGVPVVGDSPGGPSAQSFLSGVRKASGIGAVCDEEGVEFVFFDECTRVSSPEGELFQQFTVGREVVECDVLITVSKLKTHTFQMFTGAVKVLFGCIPGLEKATYHFRVPDRDDFGSMLIDLMLAVRPALSIMDGVVGMEGAGPSRGTPARIGALLASGNAVTLDVVASAMIGLDVDDVYTSRAAARRGLGPGSVEDVPVVGDDWRAMKPDGFSLPVGDLSSRAPAWLAPRVRSWITPRPVLELAHACTRCKKCEQSCPVKAIDVNSAGPQFDYKTCIRCYCCEEICPERAISTKAPPAARIFVRQP